MSKYPEILKKKRFNISQIFNINSKRKMAIKTGI